MIKTEFNNVTRFNFIRYGILISNYSCLCYYSYLLLFIFNNIVYLYMAGALYYIIIQPKEIYYYNVRA